MSNSSLTPKKLNERLDVEIHTREQFLQHLEQHHLRVDSKVREMMSTNFSFLQRIFGPRRLIKVIESQKVLEVQTEFDFMNEILQLSQEVILDVLRQKYRAQLVAYDTQVQERLIGYLEETLSRLSEALKTRRIKFAEEIRSSFVEAESFRDNPIIYPRLREAITEDFERYFRITGALLTSFENDITTNLEKYRKRE